ncbi:MAG: NAD(+)/NADH kinase [Anaerolineae bacterium]|nr:NAD(+)/NADH kinase [Anaerolineae bacterium]
MGIFHHPRKPESLKLAEAMAAMLRQRGCQPWLSSSWDKAAIAAQVAALDLIITLGGDGSILRAARLGAPHGVPILGAKMGRVSFLGEIAPDGWEEPLGRVLAGDYWLEEHMMLCATAWRAGEAISPAHEALNDVVVSRGVLARLVRIAAWVDGCQLTTYSADGIIVSTATGSTGYALAVGGPVLPPELGNILLIPIAPHLSFDRAVVLPQGASVELQIFTDHQAILTVDGQFLVELQSGDVVKVTASPHRARFVRLQDRAYFYRTLMERLRWEA